MIHHPATDPALRAQAKALDATYEALKRPTRRQRWQADECPDANGFTTIRRWDGSPTGDTDRQPIATVYEATNVPVIEAAHDLLASLCEYLQETCGVGRDAEWARMRARAQAAIAKARQP